ncbi:hypothetical protein LX36DRAFT_659925, partial [Colletotrichum falcatum]
MPSDSEASDASGASADTLRSCITVAVLPEDLLATCTSDYILERCNLSIVTGRNPEDTESELADGMLAVYHKVNGWSAHIQETGESFYTPGAKVTVDEAMVRFTGQLVPQAWLARGNKAAKEAALTPTQRVVTTLISLLPLAVYHVYLDNLFSSPQLFWALRQQGVGASGTCRKDS